MRILALIVLAFGLLPLQAEPIYRSVEMGEYEVDLRIFPGSSEMAVLGFPCDQGTGTAEVQAAETMSARGIEVWMADLLSAHFLPIAPSSMRSLTGEEVADLIDIIHRESGKPVVILSSGYGSIPTLRGAKQWQDRHRDDGADHLLGAILIYPMLTEHPPEPGTPVEYVPVVRQTSIPLVILQPANSPTRFWLRKLKKDLESGGSTVHTEILPGVRSRFYKRADATEQEMAAARRLPELIEDALSKLNP